MKRLQSSRKGICVGPIEQATSGTRVSDEESSISRVRLPVALPLFGSALALTYDVGFFYGLDISYFTLFSLAEHIVFALEALPAAFAASLMIPTGYLSYQFGWRKGVSDARGVADALGVEAKLKTLQVISKKQTIFDLLMLLGGFCCVIGGALYLHFGEYLLGPCLIILGTIAVALVLIPVGLLPPQRTLILSLACFVYLVMSFFVGLDSAHQILNATIATNEVLLKGSMEPVRGRLIRSGAGEFYFLILRVKILSC
jgi:hypothetical protein